MTISESTQNMHQQSSDAFSCGLERRHGGGHDRRDILSAIVSGQAVHSMTARGYLIAPLVMFGASTSPAMGGRADSARRHPPAPLSPEALIDLQRTLQALAALPEFAQPRPRPGRPQLRGDWGAVGHHLPREDSDLSRAARSWRPIDDPSSRCPYGSRGRTTPARRHEASRELLEGMPAKPRARGGSCRPAARRHP